MIKSQLTSSPRINVRLKQAEPNWGSGVCVKGQGTQTARAGGAGMCMAGRPVYHWQKFAGGTCQLVASLSG